MDPFIDNLSQLEIKIQQIEKGLKSQRHLFLSYQMNHQPMATDSLLPSASYSVNQVKEEGNQRSHEMNQSNKKKKDNGLKKSSSPILTHHQQRKRPFSLEQNEKNEKRINDNNKKQRKNNSSNKKSSSSQNNYTINYPYVSSNDHSITTAMLQPSDWPHPNAPYSNPILFSQQQQQQEIGPFDIYPSYTDQQQHHHHHPSPLALSDYTDDGHGDHTSSFSYSSSSSSSSSSSTSSSSSPSHLMYFNPSTSPLPNYPQTPSLIPSTSDSTTHSSVSKSLNHLLPNTTADSIHTTTTMTSPIPQPSCTIMDMYHFNMGNLMTFGSQPIDPIMHSGWYC